MIGTGALLVGCNASTSPYSGDPASAAAGYPLEYDNCGLTVSVADPPERVVSLNQSATELLIRLGAAERVVGTAYQTDPVPDDIRAAYESIPLLTDGILTHEGLLEAQPDFVYSSYASFLTADNAGERAELHSLGVPTYLTEFDCIYHAAVDEASFALLNEEIRDIAHILDVAPAGEELVAEQEATVRQGLDVAEAIEGEPSVVWFYSTAASAATPSVAGPGGLPQHVSELLGLRNLFDDAANKWPEVSWDEVAARDPEFIVLADLTRGYPGDTAAEKIEFLTTDPLMSQLEAVREERFIVVPGQYMDPSINSVRAVPAVAEGIVDLQGRAR
ncbi:ABC transporter substrate-binding protein [Microbacterium album]|uniref:ABC transporter substrate-binding protein n=1 Tax=Microbacterium album TaxID=2053191 RepID=UPI001E51DA60|nr:ABC transporter substrate-binding protein [Microbacterium album]